MAKTMGGDLVLQLLQEFRAHQQDYKHFKHEMLELKHEMLEFKQDSWGFKKEMLEFKQNMLGFKQDMLGFKLTVEVRLDLLHQASVETLNYLKHIVRVLQPMKVQVDDHEQRLVGKEKE